MNFNIKNSSYVLTLMLIMFLLYGCKKAKKDPVSNPVHYVPSISEYKSIRTVATFTIYNNKVYDEAHSGVLLSTSAGVNFNQYDTTALLDKNDSILFWQKGLIPDTKYYARYYYFIEDDTVYSDEISFFTANQIIYDNVTLSTSNHSYPEIRAGENLVIEPSPLANISVINNDIYTKSIEIYINDILYERPTFVGAEHPSFTYNTTPRLNNYPILLPCDYAPGTYRIKVFIDGVPSQELSVQVDAFVPYSNPSSIGIADRTLVYGSETLTLQNFSINDKRSTIGISVGGTIFSVSGNDYIFQDYFTELGKGVMEVKLIQECGELSLGTIEIL